MLRNYSRVASNVCLAFPGSSTPVQPCWAGTVTPRLVQQLGAGLPTASRACEPLRPAIMLVSRERKTEVSTGQRPVSRPRTRRLLARCRHKRFDVPLSNCPSHCNDQRDPRKSRSRRIPSPSGQHAGRGNRTGRRTCLDARLGGGVTDIARPANAQAHPRLGSDSRHARGRAEHVPGPLFRASVETKRRCIAERESEGQNDVVSHNGYYGAYQMSPELARGATWMMSREHRVILGDQAAVRVLAKLRGTPLSRWPRYWQDAAFSTIYNWQGTGSGAAHWRGGRWHC